MNQRPKSNESISSEIPMGQILERIIDDEMEPRCNALLYPQQTLKSNDPVVGRCTDAYHPVLSGRIRVHYEVSGQKLEQWLPTLHGMTFRKNDRVLIQFPQNAEEPIVTGVIDGYEKRPDIERDGGPSLTLENDESVKILSREGARILEVFPSEQGPVIRLCSKDTCIDLDGKLSIRAEEIELFASQGKVALSATDDVVVQGEEIRLN